MVNNKEIYDSIKQKKIKSQRTLVPVIRNLKLANKIKYLLQIIKGGGFFLSVKKKRNIILLFTLLKHLFASLVLLASFFFKSHYLFTTEQNILYSVILFRAAL